VAINDWDARYYSFSPIPHSALSIGPYMPMGYPGALRDQRPCIECIIALVFSRSAIEMMLNLNGHVWMPSYGRSGVAECTWIAVAIHCAFSGLEVCWAWCDE
jgi:hypothetical protein